VWLEMVLNKRGRYIWVRLKQIKTGRVGWSKFLNLKVSFSSDASTIMGAIGGLIFNGVRTSE